MAGRRHKVPVPDEQAVRLASFHAVDDHPMVAVQRQQAVA